MQYFKGIIEIENLRKKLGISIDKLCLNSGVHKTTYHRIKTNKVSPRVDTLQKLYGSLKQ